MKKILFTLLLVATGFIAQAQDIPNFEFTTFNNGAFALGVGENISDGRCVAVKTAEGNNTAITQVGNTLIYTVDSAGQLRRNGRTIGLPNLAQINFYTTGRAKRLYTRQPNSRYTGSNIRG